MCGITAEAICVDKSSDVEHPPLSVHRVQSEQWGRRKTLAAFSSTFMHTQRGEK